MENILTTDYRLILTERFDHSGEILFTVTGSNAFLKKSKRGRSGRQVEGECGGFLLCVGEILRHQPEHKMGRVVERCHARGKRLDERTPGRAASEELERFGAVKSTALNHGNGFGERGNLYAADKIIDELEERAAAYGANRHDTLAHRGKHRARLFQ